MSVGLAQRIGLAVGALLVVALAGWVRFLFSDWLLADLTIGSVAVPEQARAAALLLRREADTWEGDSIEIVVGDGRPSRSVTRAALGASLSVESALAEAGKLGRSGNPFVDATTWWQALRGRLKVRWRPRVDPARMGAFVEVEQRRVERLPIAGTTDGHEFTLPGRDGIALDRATALVALERALAGSAARVELPLQPVPAPPPIALGSPDGTLFDGQEELMPEPPRSRPTSTTAPEPRAWLPTTDDDCYELPRPFCDGPRKVAAPFGAAESLANQLGLGKLETIARLIRQGPVAAWVRAAGGPAAKPTLAWPVPQGRLGRGFGYVRRAALRDRIHAGIDIVAPRGSLVHTAAPGIVVYSDNRVRGYGNLLAIVHDNGAFTLSAHCQRILVFAGEQVRRGQVVAEVGMTGLAMGPHLHFEVHVGTQATDPTTHFERDVAAVARP